MEATQRHKAGILAGAIVLAAVAARATTIHVSNAGSDTSGDGTSGNPYATLTNAVARLGTEGGTVSVASGNLTVNYTTTLATPVAIQGAGMDSTVLVRSTVMKKNRIFVMSNAVARVDGLAISGIDASDIGGIAGSIVEMREGGGTLSNARIAGCTGGSSGEGYLIYMKGAASVVSNCVLNGNSFRYSGGCGPIYALKGTIDNTLVCDNTGAATGGGIRIKGAVKVRNCTFAKNAVSSTQPATRGGGLYLEGYTVNQTKFINCIFSGNNALYDTGAGAPEWYYGGTKNQAFSNCFENCAWGADIAPLGSNGVSAALADFVNPAAGDYHPLVCSAAIDGGKVYEGIPAADLDGRPRTADSAPDIGCYEFSASAPTCAFTASPREYFAGFSPPVFTTGIAGTGSTTIRYQWTFYNESVSVADVVASGATPAPTLTAGFWTAKLEIFDAEDDPETAVALASYTRPGYIHVGVPVMYLAVPGAEGVNPAFPYESEEHASTNGLIALLTDAIHGTEIRMLEGQFIVDGTVTLSTGIRIRGRGRDRTLITRSSQSVTPQLFNLVHPQALLDGVTITNVKTSVNAPGIVWCNTKGGTFSNSRVVKCTCANASSGGIVGVNGADSRITRCQLEYNTLFGSSGNSSIYAVAGMIDNCLVYKTANATMGGGIQITGGAKVYNCTFVTNTLKGGNTAFVGGGVYWSSGATGAEIVNCVFADNIAPADTGDGTPEWYRYGGTLAQFTNCFQNCAWGSGVAPVGKRGVSVTSESFVDTTAGDYTIRRGSTCHNAGLYAAWMDDALDLAGNPRVDHKQLVDIGAYEVPYVSPGSLITIR